MKIIKREAEKPKSTMYGHKLGFSHRLGAEGATEAALEFEARKIISVELVRMNLPHPVDVIETTYLKNGVVEREYKELETVRTDEELESGQKIFKTLEMILNKRDIRSIRASSFAKEIIDRLRCDARFGYKQFCSESHKNTAHSVYIYTVLAIAVATASATNNINFEAPIDVSIFKMGVSLKLCFKMKLSDNQKIRKRDNLMSIPKLESKLAYLCALCREDGIKSTIKIVGSSLTFEYVIKEVPPEAPRLYAKEDEEKAIFDELLNAFNPPSTVDVELDEDASI